MTTFAERMVSVAETALAAGPMGNTLRPAEYREFIRCRWPLKACIIGYHPKLKRYVVGGDIGAVETSCAICAGAVSFRAGLDWDESVLTQGLRCIGKPMEENWYQLGKSSKAWAKFPHPPGEGDVFNLGDSHLGICLKHLGGGRWRTAEGGGGDGTKFQIVEKRVFDPRNPRAWDPSLGRSLKGFYRAAVIGEMLGEPVRDTLPAPCSDSDPPTVPAFRRTLKLTLPRMVGDDVKLWQQTVNLGKMPGARADAEIPTLKEDGEFGSKTDTGTRKWQAAHGLKDDGEVGPLTRAKAGL